MVDELSETEVFFVHLMRIAISGSSEEVVAYGRRVAKSTRTKSPNFSKQVSMLLENYASSGTKTALRKAPQVAVPVDRESRLDLLIVEDPVAITDQPVLGVRAASEINQLLIEHRNASALKKAGLSPANSLLLVGPPGVGKTYTARWIAASLNKALYTLNLSSVISSFLGRTSNNLSSVISFAKNANAVLFLDEFDSIAKKRDDLAEVGELKRLVTALIQEIDNWPIENILIAATNHGELLDPAVWRRFSVICHLGPPSTSQMEDFVRMELEEFDGSNLSSALATTLKGMTLSDAERVVGSIRKKSILSGESLDTCIVEEISRLSMSLERADAKELATRLIASGLSQRKVSEITRLARDTLRKSGTGRH